jgi:hypothetical protein
MVELDWIANAGQLIIMCFDQEIHRALTLTTYILAVLMGPNPLPLS